MWVVLVVVEQFFNSLGYYRSPVYPDLRNETNKLKKEIDSLQNRNTALLLDRDVIYQEKELANQALSYLRPIQSSETTEEKALNDVYPKVSIKYKCRYVNTLGGVQAVSVDPRFFFSYDAGVAAIAVQILNSTPDHSYDNLAWLAEKWVKEHITYKTDEKVQGILEYWQTCYETLKLLTSDCEDGSILMANIMIALGIPVARIRLTTGNVAGAPTPIGHAYLTYARTTDNRFVVLDWCYQPTNTLIKDRLLHRDQRDYYTVWWSCTKDYCFSTLEKTEW